MVIVGIAVFDAVTILTVKQYPPYCLGYKGYKSRFPKRAQFGVLVLHGKSGDMPNRK